MSDYHILSSDQYGNALQVIFHIPVPDVTNTVGNSYRTALVEYQDGADLIESAYVSISPQELAQLKSGELYEHTLTFNSNPGQTLLQKRDTLDALYAQSVTQIQQQLQTRLAFWGYSRDVP
jgi:hypothetical protein